MVSYTINKRARSGWSGRESRNCTHNVSRPRIFRIFGGVLTESDSFISTRLPGEMTRGIQLAPLRNLDGLSDKLFAENRLPALTLAVLRNTRYDTPLKALSGTGVGVGLNSLATTDFSFLDPGVYIPVKARSFLTNDTDRSMLYNQATTVQNPDARCPINIHKMRIDHLVS
jgi:hypothetical protein